MCWFERLKVGCADASEQHQAVAEIERLREELQIHRDKAQDNYWAWQGDGEDHLESLVCPVLIQPSQLSAILQAAKAAEEE